MTIHPAPATGRLTIRLETAGRSQPSGDLGSYLIRGEAGQITGVEMLCPDLSALPPGARLCRTLPAGARIGLFLIGEPAPDIACPSGLASSSGLWRFVTDAGQPATLHSRAPRLEHVAADGRVTPVAGPIRHAAGFGPSLGLDPDGRVALQSLGATAEGGWRLVWREDGPAMRVTLQGEGLDLTAPGLAIQRPGLLAGTLIATPQGLCPVERLSPGQRVLTRDRGFRPLTWIGRSRLGPQALAARPELRPIRIAAGAFGPCLPEHPLRLSPQHRLLLIGTAAQRLFGRREVLLAAGHLLGLPGIHHDTAPAAELLHLLLADHEILCTEGLWTESFQPGPGGLAALDTADRTRLIALHPALMTGRRPFPAARPVLRGTEARHRLALGGPIPKPKPHTRPSPVDTPRAAA